LNPTNEIAAGSGRTAKAAGRLESRRVAPLNSAHEPARRRPFAARNANAASAAMES
jgi:hypothetical protein